MFNVDANLFRLAYLAVSTEETRYYLNGVSIEAHPQGGVLLVATDGWRMLCLHDADGTLSGPSVIVRLDKAALTACKPDKRDGNHKADGLPKGRRLTAGDDPKGLAIVMHADGEQIAIQNNWRIDGTFPDWKRVTPRDIPATSEPAQFNPSLLDSFGAVSKGLGFGGHIAIGTNGPNNPALIRFPGIDHAFGVCMPAPTKGQPVVAIALPGFMATFAPIPEPEAIAA